MNGSEAITCEIPNSFYIGFGNLSKSVGLVKPGEDSFEIVIHGQASCNFTFGVASCKDGRVSSQSFTSVISEGQNKYYSVLQSSSGQMTSIYWEYVFKDTKRGTMLKVSTDDKYFQFIAPDKNFGVKYDPKMFVKYGIIIICYGDAEMRLTATAVDGYFYYCTALAYDKQTRKTYALIDKSIGPRCLRLYDPL